MINPENYLSNIASVEINAMPMPLQKGHEFLMKATANATDWNTYHNSTAIRKTIQLYFERLNEFIQESGKIALRLSHFQELKSYYKFWDLP